MTVKKLHREQKRARKMRGYHAAGLNGPRAMERRARQRQTGCGDQSRGAKAA